MPSKPRTVRLVEIAELLSVSKQRAHQLAEENDVPAPISRDRRGRLWDRRESRGMGEALAAREAVALAEELEPLPVSLI
jgi:hypothetical protein